MLIFLLGYVENKQDKKFFAKETRSIKEKAHELMAKFNTAEKVNASLQRTQQLLG